MRFSWNIFLWVVITSMIFITIVTHHRRYNQPKDDNFPLNDPPRVVIISSASPKILPLITKMPEKPMIASVESITRSTTTAKVIPQVTRPPPDMSFKLNFTRKEACEKWPERRKLITIIFSEPTHFSNREMIRSTWISYLNSSDINGTYLFIIGATPNEPIQKRIREEKDKYDDIIQYDVLDTYRNLAYKTLATLKFLNTFCSKSNFEYVLKTDDDMFVNVPQLISFAAQHYLCGRYHSKSFFCHDYRPRDVVPRDRNDKWYVSFDEYPDLTYPKFCAGTGYMFTWDLVEQLWKVAETTPVYAFEDVYIGMCAQKVGNVSFVPFPPHSLEHTAQNFQSIAAHHQRNLKSEVKVPSKANCN